MPVSVNKPSPLLPDSNWSERSDLCQAASCLADKFSIHFVYLAKNENYSSFTSSHSCPWHIQEERLHKIAILWDAFPMDPAAIFSWRCGLVEVSGVSFKFLDLPDKKPPDWYSWLKERLGAWTKKKPEKEEKGLGAGELVSYPQENPLASMSGYDPAFLTISPKGKMTEVLEQLDECKRMYHEVICSNTPVRERRRKVHEVLDRLLAAEYSTIKDINKRRKAIQKLSAALKESLEKNFDVKRNRLPKVLLLGPSGVGKTLVARYLAWRLAGSEGGSSRPFKRISIPTYLQKESDFEFDLFGYCNGAYTNALPGGNRGFLLENMGGVIFFDEIGEATLAIQAKLLAYLDDYQVRPKGWSGESIFCPMLLVAATNRRIDEWAEKDDGVSDSEEFFFRNDLRRRFNCLVHIPSISERKGELPFILDTMLQMEAFNPGSEIREVGKKALQAIMDYNYDRGNFRDLENLVRDACRNARNDGRTYLVENDVKTSDT